MHFFCSQELSLKKQNLNYFLNVAYFCEFKTIVLLKLNLRTEIRMI